VFVHLVWYARGAWVLAGLGRREGEGMKGFGYNILADKLRRPYMSLKSVKAWLRFKGANWPYASTRQIERQQRQMADRLALPEAMERVRAKLQEIAPSSAYRVGPRELRLMAKSLLKAEHLTKT
jgi:hypothetical protein